ncbi:MAG: calcium/sodium antiporter [Tannerellaceae bacterium]
MILNILLLLLSLAMLYFGAEGLVRGSSSLAIRAKVSPLVVGLTIVAFGTSSPELVVSLNATLAGQGDISIGNVVGSNIFNICVILGIAAIIQPMNVRKQLTQIDVPIMIGVAALFTAMFWHGHLSRIAGAILFIGIIAYTVFSIIYAKKEGKKHPESLEEFDSFKASKSVWLDLLYIAIGLVILIIASNLLVKSSVFIAKAMGVSEAVIGLTIIAAGTSMPELATSIVAAIRKNPEIAIGNVVGSNIFNILSILGISSLIKPISAPNVNYIDLLVMLAVSVVLLPLMRHKYKISRGEGIFLFLIYIGYTIYLLRNIAA